MAPGPQPIPAKKTPTPVIAPSSTPTPSSTSTPAASSSSPAEDGFEVVTTTLTSFFGSVTSLFSFRGNPGVKDLDAEIKDTEQRARTVSGPALTQALERLQRLKRVKSMTDVLTADEKSPNYLKIHREDIYRLKKTAVDKLLAGVANPPNDKDYEEGTRLFQALWRYSKLEQARTQLRGQIESFYPGPKSESKILYRLDFEGMSDDDLDPKYYPPLERIENLPFLQAYRTLRDSSEPEEKEVAAYVERLFKHFDNENENYDRGVIGPENSDPVSYVNSLSGTLEGLVTDPKLKIFSERITQVKRDNADADGSAAERAQLQISEGLSTLVQLPNLITALTEYQTRVAGRVPPIPLEQQRIMLRDTCQLFIDRAERCSFPVQDSIDEAKKQLEVLESTTLTQGDLNQVAAKLAPVATSLRDMEENSVVAAYGTLIDEVEKIPSEEDNIAPLRQALKDLPESPEKRLPALLDLSKKITEAGAIRLVEARIKVIQSQTEAKFTSISLLEGFVAAMPGAPVGASGSYYQSQSPHLAQFKEMEDDYRQILQLLKTQDPGEDSNARPLVPAAYERERGLKLLQKIEGVRQHEILRDIADSAVIINQTFVIGAVVLATLPLFIEAVPATAIGGTALGELSLLEVGSLGLRSALARTTLSLGLQRGLTTVGTYALGSLAVTTVSRNYTSLIMGESALQHGFGTEFLINLAFMGGGSLASRGATVAIDAAAEAVAVRNIASRGGSIVLAEGRAAVVPGTMDDALKAAIDLEKKQVLETTFARFAQTAGPLGAELAAFQTMECLKTAAILAHQGVADPLSKAFSRITSARSQAFLLGPILIGHTMNGMKSDAGAYVTEARRVEYNAISRAYEKDLASFKSLYENQAFDADGSPNKTLMTDPDFRASAAKLLQQRQDMIALVEPSSRTPEMLVEYDKNRTYLGLVETAGKFEEGMQTVFGDGNAFGVRASGEDGMSFTYDRSVQGKTSIEGLLKDLPWVDKQNVRVNPNGMIEIPLLAGPFTPEAGTIRLFPAK